MGNEWSNILPKSSQARKKPPLLQSCPAYNTLQHQAWTQGAEMMEMLWGYIEDLEMTVGFVQASGLQI